MDWNPARRSWQLKLRAVPSNKLLNLTPDDLADQFLQRFHIEVPVIHDADIQVSQNEAQVDVGHDPMRAVFDRSRPFYVAGTSVTFHVPFDGEAQMLGAKPAMIHDSHHRVSRDPVAGLMVSQRTASVTQRAWRSPEG